MWNDGPMLDALNAAMLAHRRGNSTEYSLLINCAVARAVTTYRVEPESPSPVPAVAPKIKDGLFPYEAD